MSQSNPNPKPPPEQQPNPECDATAAAASFSSTSSSVSVSADLTSSASPSKPERTISELTAELRSVQARCLDVQERLAFLVTPDVFRKIEQVRKMAEDVGVGENEVAVDIAEEAEADKEKPDEEMEQGEEAEKKDE